jgi:hypothetical protein
MAGGALALGLGLAALRARRPKTLRERLADELDVRSALEALREAMEEARKHVPQNGRAVRQVLEQRLKPLALATRRELPRRTRRAIELLEAEREHLARTLEREVAPATQRLAQEALREAEDLLSSVRQRAEAVAERVPTELAGRTRGRAGTVWELVSDLAPARARRRGVRARMRTSGASRLPNRLLARAGQMLRETAAIGFWAGVVGALVYFGLLDDEQRSRLHRAMSTAWVQIQDLLADFRSEDTAFAELSQ